MAVIGYARVSASTQDLASQEDALRATGCERIYADHGASGAKASRPEWDRCRDALRTDVRVGGTERVKVLLHFRFVTSALQRPHQAGKHPLVFGSRRP